MVKHAGNNRTVVFTVASAALVPRKQSGKHISAAVKNTQTLEEAVFSMVATPRLYNEDIRQLELELRKSLEEYVQYNMEYMKRESLQNIQAMGYLLNGIMGYSQH